MDDLTTLARALWLVLAAFLMVAAFRFAWLPSLADQLRHKVFCLRRQLFLLMLNGQLRPDEPAYTELRDSMNAILRFAERMTPVRAMLAAAVFSGQTRSLTQRRTEVIMAVHDAELRARLHAIERDLALSAFGHAMLVSPLAWLMLATALAGALMLRGITGLVAFWRTLPRRIISSEIAAELGRNDGVGLAV